MSTAEQKPKAPEYLEILGTNGLALKQLTKDDAQAYHQALHHDPERFKHGEENTLKKYETVDDVLARMEDPDPNRLRLGIWDGNLLVGTVNLQFNRPGSAELGYWSGYSGHDYSERGARLLIDYAFANFDLKKLTAWVATENLGSHKVIERLGFTRTTNGEEQVMYELARPS